ncbi:MAG: phosphoenolpyruvate synthase, partial [Firmicutes bacterium]|nr:phosphoenolpyruvate synthase [Bacillota bacterium]
YEAFVQANALQARIETLAASAEGAGASAFDQTSSAIRSLLDNGAIPTGISQAVIEGYAALGGGPVAVRSSATAEDLPGASFAGQQETYLNLIGPEQVLDGVRRCWSSLWTARALAYRSRQGISPAAVSLAVVVQRLVPSEAAGILFTANPVNGRRDQMVIDGAWGLGEAVVSGQVTPDHWVVGGATGALLSSSIADKALMTVREAGGTATLPVPASLRRQASLSGEQVTALARLGRQVATHYGSPQDIEWAWAEGQFYLVQSRPITSLFPLPEPRPKPEAGLRVYICFNSLQGLVEPLTPMGISAFRAFGRGLARLAGARLKPGEWPPALTMAAGRIYLDATNGVRHPVTRTAILMLTTLMDRPMSEALASIVEREPSLAPRRGRSPLRPSLGTLLPVGWRALSALASPNATRRRLLGRLEADVQALEQEADRLQGPLARRRFLDQVLSSFFSKLAGNLGPLVVSGFGLRFAIEGRLKKWLGETGGLQPVLRSLPHNPTTEMGLALWQLSRGLRQEGAEPSADHPAVRAFLARYGHRAVREIDIGMPRWNEDPAHVLNILKTYLAHDEQANPERQFQQGAEEAEKAAAALVAEVRARRGPAQAAVLRFLLSRLRALAGLREYPKFYAVRTIALNRRVLLGLGAELVAADRLDQPDDIFFL